MTDIEKIKEAINEVEQSIDGMSDEVCCVESNIEDAQGSIGYLYDNISYAETEIRKLRDVISKLQPTIEEGFQSISIEEYNEYLSLKEFKENFDKFIDDNYIGSAEDGKLCIS